MTRAEKIKAGKIWQVDTAPDALLFEGTKMACLKWLRTNGHWREYKRGKISLSRLIWEPL